MNPIPDVLGATKLGLTLEQVKDNEASHCIEDGRTTRFPLQNGSYIERMQNEIIRPGPANVLDEGPFYHGTKAELRIGDFLKAGFRSNYKPEIVMNHIYFTALVNGAGLAAALAAGDGRERVYVVEPTGSYENDPNVTDKKFPGNPTRSYRSREPLKIIGEVMDWVRPNPEELRKWRERLAAIKADARAEIIN